MKDPKEATSTKPSNPKAAVGVRKVPRSTVSAPVLSELGVALLEGSCKYGRHNYRVAGCRFSTYYDAACRHLDHWWEGEDIDPDSGISHITKAIAGLVVLRDAMISGNVTDDRPPRPPARWYVDLDAKAGALLDKYPDPVDAFTALDHPPPAADIE